LIPFAKRCVRGVEKRENVYTNEDVMTVRRPQEKKREQETILLIWRADRKRPGRGSFHSGRKKKTQEFLEARQGVSRGAWEKEGAVSSMPHVELSLRKEVRAQCAGRCARKE